MQNAETQPSDATEYVELKESAAADCWRAAWFATPGPRSWCDAAGLAGRGFCMGAADIIPGVSGGTIAFITGIYEQLLAAIASFDKNFAAAVLHGRFREALAGVHLRFLVTLLTGIGLAIYSTAKLTHFLITDHPVPTWSFFCGLIAASIVFVGKQVSHWRAAVLPLIAGSVAAWFIVGMIPRQTPEGYWFIFLCGMIAICAMILPGISGSFLLLILGKYEIITGAVKDPFRVDHALLMIVFACGAIVGITAFSRILKYMLAHWHNVTMALLMGFMIGGMRKIWPWKEVLEKVLVNNKEKTLRDQNILPAQFGGEEMFAVSLMVLGFLLVVLLEYIANRKSDTAQT